MDTEAELVRIAEDGHEVDGIVFDAPSKTKVTVAVMDAAKGPVFRTVHPDTLSERTEENPDDRALLLLIRRTWRSKGGSGRAAGTGGQSREGHKRSAMHRTTGK